MRPIITIFCAALLFGSTNAKAGDQSCFLRLSNKDKISGKLLNLTNDNLTWTAPWLEKPVDFKLSHILDITLNSTPSIPDADHVAIVTMKNGDIARGQLNSVTENSIELTTWYAGKLSFNRLMVENIKIEEAGPVIYRGPNSMDGWIQPKDTSTWQYHNSAFISTGTGSIARNELLPDEFSIKFKVQHKGSDFNMKVTLFSDEADSTNPDSGYECSFRRTYCYIRKSFDNKPIGRTTLPELAQNKEADLEIKASRRTGKVALLINGRIAGVWTDQNTDKGSYGKALHFSALNSEPIRISEIVVKKWDGEIDDVPANQLQFANRFGRQAIPQPEKKPEKPDEDSMKLANGDSITGEVTSIKDAIATLETPLGEFSIPVSRMRTLALKNLGTEESMLDPDDIRATFADGTSLTFRLDQVDGKTIVGSSQNFGTNSEFGTAIFDLSSMEQIEFDIHNTKLNSIRSEDSW